MYTTPRINAEGIKRLILQLLNDHDMHVVKHTPITALIIAFVATGLSKWRRPGKKPKNTTTQMELSGVFVVLPIRPK